MGLISYIVQRVDIRLAIRPITIPHIRHQLYHPFISIMAQLPRLQTPTDKELLLVLEWTAHAQDPSGTQPPPRTQQEIEESIANDEFEDFSDASSMGSAGDIVEVDPDFDTERFLYRSGSILSSP
jgi:hypothetical protein